ncbi:MAG: hypothetical protein KKA61_00405 [Nanoarchaeota archaeon]|nr:hypothetical protein [Nanoarchaeota archaeon]MBU4283966.1 hypothetical protein [Nanoarchaeota archaeon]MBU4492811.1 hypothetical protein [Nanoarchaeota archaeon]
MKTKKAQIKMFETIAVLLIFFVLIGFGLIFYVRVYSGGIQETGEEYFELKAIQTAQLVSFLPELQCTSPTSMSIVDDNCFDLLKVKALSGIISDPENQKLRNEYYYDLFGFSKISIEQIYPSEMKWDVYDKSPANKKSMSSIKIPISLYNASSRENNFGVLNIDIYN